MTTRFVGLMTAMLACTFFVAACDRKQPPTPACIEAARLYAEALEVNTLAPPGEKAEGVSVKEQALKALEERKVQACGE